MHLCLPSPAIRNCFGIEYKLFLGGDLFSGSEGINKIRETLCSSDWLVEHPCVFEQVGVFSFKIGQ